MENLEQGRIKIFEYKEETETDAAVIFDISKAKRIVKRNGASIPTCEIRLSDYFPAHDTHINEDYAVKKTNYSNPIIAATFYDYHAKKWEVIIIDGWHRSFHAWKDGRETITAYLLNKRQTRSCLMWGW